MKLHNCTTTDAPFYYLDLRIIDVFVSRGIDESCTQIAALFSFGASLVLVAILALIVALAFGAGEATRTWRYNRRADRALRAHRAALGARID